MIDKDNMPVDTDDAQDIDPNLTANDVASDDVSAAATASVLGTPHKGLGLGGAVLLFLLASVAGSAGGFALSRYIIPAPATDITAALSPLSTQIEASDTILSEQAAQLTRLQSRIEALAARPAAAGSNTVGLELPENRSGNRAEVAALEAEISTLRADMTAMGASLKAVASTVAAQGQGSKSADSIAVETTTVDAQTAPIVDTRVDRLSTDLTTLQSRVDSLEANLSETRDLAIRPTIIREPVLLPPFPRDAVFEAMTEVPVAADAGWVSKTLKKHISVRNPEQVKLAERELLAITTAIEDNKIDRALELVLALPAAPRAVATAWISAAQSGQDGSNQNRITE